MAETTGNKNTGDGNLEALRASLITECAEQSGNTVYTSTEFYIYLRFLRFWRGLLWILAVVASSIAASSAVSDLGIPSVVVAGLTLAGVLLPGVIKALKIEEAIDAYAVQAGLFKNAEGALRRAANVWSNKTMEEFEAEARTAIALLDEARLTSLTPPEWAFKLAQWKIGKGDYTPDPLPKKDEAQ